MVVKCPAELTAQQVWEILAQYGHTVGRTHEMLFGGNYKYISLAAKQYGNQDHRLI